MRPRETRDGLKLLWNWTTVVLNWQLEFVANGSSFVVSDWITTTTDASPFAVAIRLETTFFVDSDESYVAVVRYI